MVDNTTKKTNAKKMGFTIVNEFGCDISTITYVVVESEQITVYDEFNMNITNIVKISR